MLDLDGVADIVALDLNFLGGSAYDDDIGVWNGTGSCTTHHGESDCYADIYNLCTRSVTKGYWPVTECLFQNQPKLCPLSWDAEEGACGSDDYDAEAFDPVIANCTSGLSEDEVALIIECAVSGDSHEAMGDLGRQLLVDNFAASAEADPEGKPVWINVNGKLVDDADFDTPEAWGDAVLAAICDAYTGSNVPAACSSAKA